MANVIQLLIRARDKSGPGFKGINLNLAGMAKGAVAAGAALAAMAGAATVALAKLVQETAKTADAAGKAAQGVGLTVERFTALRFVAGQSALATQQFEQAMGKLALPVGKAQAALDELNITGATADERLLQLADRFAGMEDGTEKTALALRIFGEDLGRKVVPFLNQGSAGISELTRRAQKLGVVITKDTADAAAKFNDKLDDLQSAAKGLGLQIGAGLLPQTSELVEEVSDLVVEYDLVAKAVDGTRASFEALKPVFSDMIDLVKRLAIAQEGPQGLFKRVTGDLIAGAAKSLTGGGRPQSEFQEGGTNPFFPGAGEEGGPFTFSPEAFEHLQGILDARQEMIDEAAQIELESWIDIGNQRVAIEKQISDRIAALEENRKRAAMASVQLTGALMGQLAALAEQGGKKNFELVQGLRIGEAVMNTAASVMETFTRFGGWPTGVVPAGIMAGIGAAQVATIASQKPSFAIGTGFVPADMTANIHRGERIVPSTDNQDLTRFLDEQQHQTVRLMVFLDSRQILDEVADASRDGRLEIHQRAVV